MIGTLYEMSLTGAASIEVEHADARRNPLRVDRWFDALPGDASLLDRCHGPTLDVGSGPGRLTLALAQRGQVALGIDVTPRAVELTRRAGAPALNRDVFGRVPGAGRWQTVLLADGNIGIGGDPGELLQRAAELLSPSGRVLIELDPPGHETGKELVRLRDGAQWGPWFTWAYVSADGIEKVASAAGLDIRERWKERDRWFVALERA